MENYSCLDIIDLYHELPSNSSFPVNTETKKSARATLEACAIGLHYEPVINQTSLINGRMHFIQTSFHQLEEAAMSATVKHGRIWYSLWRAGWR